MHDKKPFGRTVAAIKTVKQLLATSSGVPLHVRSKCVKTCWRRHHVDVEMFSLGTFFVHEKEYRLVCRCILEDDSHDLKQGFAQNSGAALGD